MHAPDRVSRGRKGRKWERTMTSDERLGLALLLRGHGYRELAAGLQIEGGRHSSDVKTV